MARLLRMFNTIADEADPPRSSTGYDGDGLRGSGGEAAVFGLRASGRETRSCVDVC